VTAFHEAMKQYNYAPEHVLPHGSYLLNLANPDEAKREQSYSCFIDDLKRAEQLGLLLYNFQ
jgi:AP endonuclease 1